MSRPLLRFALPFVLVIAAFAPLAVAAPAATPSPPAPPVSAAPVSPPPAVASAGPEAQAPAKKNFTDAIPCAACHTTTAWKQQGASGESAKFDHSTTGFPLTGEHIHAPCTGCHNAKTALKRACASCHVDFHRGRLLQSCDTCHTPAGWKMTRPLELHRMTRFPLTGMHVLTDCTECHVRASEHQWTDAPIECFACHEKDYRRPNIFPVHVGTSTAAPLPRDCSLCHRAIAWVPATVPASLSGSVASQLQVAPSNHNLRFPIAFGAHRTASCDDCHASQAVPRATRCIGCHAHDPVAVMRQHRQPVAMDGPACLSCHPGGVRR